MRQVGFARFLAPLHDQILELAVQPDSWGERTRARLIAEVFAGLKGVPAEQASVEEIAHVSNVVVPCFLLELGRRRRHIEIEFPMDPCDSAARFGLRVGPSSPNHSISSDELIRLVAGAGEELVGLCYFGDQQSREDIEMWLARTGPYDHFRHSATPVISLRKEALATFGLEPLPPVSIRTTSTSSSLSLAVLETS